VQNERVQRMSGTRERAPASPIQGRSLKLKNEPSNESRRELEICVDEPESAKAALLGGADRLEVCSALQAGGLTPASSFVSWLRETTDLPLHVMIRPRSGGFVYSAPERELMLRDIQGLLALGADGVVVGALTAAGEVDYDFVEQLVSSAGDSHVSFHRAIDCLESPSSAVQRLADLGIQRVLSSGGASTAIEGASELAIMHEQAPSEISIMAGAGVRSTNLRELLERTGVRHVHGSAAKLEATNDRVIPGRVSFCEVSDGSPSIRRTSLLEVRALREILDS
jgi:copper homeostasis protein